MNEPHDMRDDDRWPAAVQAAVDEIRNIDVTHTIFVARDHWSGAHSWRNTSNENLGIQDPADAIVYEAHQYFDGENSGIYDKSYDGEGAYENVGADRVRPFVERLQIKSKKGFIGEFGVPNNDPRWNTVLDNFLFYLHFNYAGEKGMGNRLGALQYVVARSVTFLIPGCFLLLGRALDGKLWRVKTPGLVLLVVSVPFGLIAPCSTCAPLSDGCVSLSTRWS
jgi:Cellulase (glycosyl hydrolase family 5)